MAAANGWNVQWIECEASEGRREESERRVARAGTQFGKSCCQSRTDFFAAVAAACLASAAAAAAAYSRPQRLCSRCRAASKAESRAESRRRSRARAHAIATRPSDQPEGIPAPASLSVSPSLAPALACSCLTFFAVALSHHPYFRQLLRQRLGCSAEGVCLRRETVTLNRVCP